ncbi:DNA-binding transcriptional regulator AraC [Bacteroidales bacterium Barb4]|nr:DNA-binding transcriptional regulator AraC [Bacteroidales bacterium Barb4]
MLSSELTSPRIWLEKIAESFDAPIEANRVNVNPAQGKGYIEWHTIETGFDLMLTDIVPCEDFSFYREKSDYKGIMIKYLIETPAVCSFVDTDDEKHRITEEGIVVSTSGYPETTLTKADCRYKIAVFLLSFDLIRKYHDDRSFLLNTAVTEHPLFAFEKASPMIQRLSLNLFLTNESDLPYKPFYIRAAAIELLVKIGGLFDYRKPVPFKAAVKSREDINLLFRVRKRLTGHFENDRPTVQSLSGEFGISPTKLKMDFRLLFGKPIFCYFQEERMEFAKKLMETAQYSVSDVGYKVGYSNLSKFTAAYKKQFGFNPKETPALRESMSERDKR